MIVLRSGCFPDTRLNKYVDYYSEIYYLYCFKINEGSTIATVVFDAHFVVFILEKAANKIHERLNAYKDNVMLADSKIYKGELRVLMNNSLSALTGDKKDGEWLNEELKKQFRSEFDSTIKYICRTGIVRL